MLDPGDDAQRRERVAFIKSTIAVIVALAILVGGGVFMVSKAGQWWQEFTESDDYDGHGTTPVSVVIPPGASLAQIGTLLVDSDVVKSRAAWGRAVRINSASTKIQPGRFNLKKQMEAEFAVDALLDPKNRSVKKVTIPEGLTWKEMVARLAKDTPYDANQITAAVKKVKLNPWAGGKPEGYLFPSTYEYDPQAAPEELLQAMADQFTKVANKLKLAERAKALQVTPQQLVSLASIVEFEVFRAEDRPKVARVLYNRLSKDMHLQLDSTVIYARGGKDGKATTTDKDRANPSPYNTYLHKGLPPGPIDAPGESALKAAAHPAEGPWLYFVATNLDTGETRFATTFAEHNANVKLFQQWCQANKGKC